MIRDLFIDTTNSCLVLIYSADNVVIDSYINLNENRASDSINDQINILLEKNNTSLADINNYYIIKGPGSYTGVKVGIMIGIVAKTVNNDVNVYLLSSLQFLAQNKKAISIIDAKSKKSYVGVYDIDNELFPDQILNNDFLDPFIGNVKESLGDFEVFCDYSKIDFINTFTKLKANFRVCDNVEDITPLYLKKAI